MRSEIVQSMSYSHPHPLPKGEGAKFNPSPFGRGQGEGMTYFARKSDPRNEDMKASYRQKTL
jgi:hypothetical protein